MKHTPEHIRKARKRAERLSERVLLPWFCIVASLMVYGIFRYPYAPIHYEDGGYFDKTGGSFPAEKFPAYQVWQRSLYISFAGTAGSGIVVSLIAWHLTHNSKPASH